MVNQCHMDQDQCRSRDTDLEPGAFVGEGRRCVAWPEDSLLKCRMGTVWKGIFRKAPATHW